MGGKCFWVEEFVESGKEEVCIWGGAFDELEDVPGYLYFVFFKLEEKVVDEVLILVHIIL